AKDRRLGLGRLVLALAFRGRVLLDDPDLHAGDRLILLRGLQKHRPRDHRGGLLERLAVLPQQRLDAGATEPARDRTPQAHWSLSPLFIDRRSSSKGVVRTEGKAARIVSVAEPSRRRRR